MTPRLSAFSHGALLVLTAAFVCGCASTRKVPQHSLAAGASLADADWNAAAVQDVLAYARAQQTTGPLIIQNRRIIVEHDWPLPPDAASFRAAFVHGQAADGALLEDVASQQKRFIAILIGVAVDQGLIDVDKAVADYLGPR